MLHESQANLLILTFFSCLIFKEFTLKMINDWADCRLHSRDPFRRVIVLHVPSWRLAGILHALMIIYYDGAVRIVFHFDLRVSQDSIVLAAVDVLR